LSAVLNRFPDVLGQLIGIRFHDPNAVVSIGLEYLHGKCRGDSMTLKEEHHVPNCLLLRPGPADHLYSLFANALNVHQLPRTLFDYGECPTPNRWTIRLAMIGPTPLIRPDPDTSPRPLWLPADRVVSLNLKLPAELLVAGPSTKQAHALAGDRTAHAANNRHEVPRAIHAQSSYGVSGLLGVKRNALDDAFQPILRMGGVRLHYRDDVIKAMGTVDCRQSDGL